MSFTIFNHIEEKSHLVQVHHHYLWCPWCSPNCGPSCNARLRSEILMYIIWTYLRLCKCVVKYSVLESNYSGIFCFDSSIGAHFFIYVKIFESSGEPASSRITMFVLWKLMRVENCEFETDFCSLNCEQNDVTLFYW